MEPDNELRLFLFRRHSSPGRHGNAMSRGGEYRQLVVSIGKASLARKMPKPAVLELIDNVLLGSVAALVVLVLLLVLAELGNNGPRSLMRF